MAANKQPPEALRELIEGVLPSGPLDETDLSEKSAHVMKPVFEFLEAVLTHEQAKSGSLWEHLMRNFEITKRIRGGYRISKDKMIVSGPSISALEYLAVAVGFFLIGTQDDDLRFQNVALKILDQECGNQDLAGKLRALVLSRLA